MSDSELVYGIDVSPHQGDKIDWAAVRASGVECCWVKTSEGNGWESPVLRSHVLGAHRAGIRVGAYHYAREAISDPITAATHHVELTADLPIRLRHMLDIEWDKDEAGMKPHELVNWNLQWLQRVYSMGHGVPCVYSSEGYLLGRLGSDAARLQSYPLVTAAYRWDKPGWESVREQPTFNVERTRIAHEMLSKRYHMSVFAWQFTGLGRVPGIPGPVDRIVTTRSNLESLSWPPPDLASVPEWKTTNDVSGFVNKLVSE